VNSRVKLVGENKTTTIIDGDALGTVVLVTVSGVSISGFTIRNSAQGYPNSGILIDKANDCNVSSNIVENSDHGILVNYTRNIFLTNNEFIDNWAAIELFLSPNSAITYNNVTNNEFGIWVYQSDNNSLSNNTVTKDAYGFWLFDSSNATLRNNSLTLNQYNFGVWGSNITHYIHQIDASNMVDNKPIYYWINRYQTEIPSDAGYVALVDSTQITVRNITLGNNGQGVLLAYAENSSVTDIHSVNNRVGIELFSSSNNVIINNNLTENMYGLLQSDSSSNLLADNTVADNRFGIKLTNSSDNFIQRNAFTNNTVQVITSESINIWDDGYPRGGNYWSDHASIDSKSGPDQDQPGSDGIDDSAYILDASNTDRYPVMNPVAIHDVAVTLTVPRTIVGQGYSLYINVQAINKGNRLEIVNVTVLANSTLIATQSINLTIGTTSLLLPWDATGFTRGNYTISVIAWPVPNETETSDNSFTYSNVITVTVPGDTDGDLDIDIHDMVRLASVYGATRGEVRFNPNCDIDGNDEINIYDIVIALSNYGYKAT
jgi:parallel beta-helix repeat protein